MTEGKAWLPFFLFPYQKLEYIEVRITPISVGLYSRKKKQEEKVEENELRPSHVI